MPFKDFFLKLWWPFCSAEQNQLCNLVEGIIRNNSAKCFLNLDQWFKRCRLKIFLIWSSGGVQQGETTCAILVEVIMKNNYVNLF